jgi:GMP synthase (glutamine-hydrolysing)
MRPLLFVRADSSETFGIAPAAVRDAGAHTVVWDAIGGDPAPALDDVAGIVMFGSAFNVEHADEQPFIHEMSAVTLEALARRLPYLGICFGAQVLAWSLGNAVERSPVREVGYVSLHPTAAASDDPVLGHYADGDMVFEWHMDTFVLPADATLLATGDDVRNQAYRLRDTTWATQFHFEIDRPEMDVWIDEMDAIETTWGKSGAAIRAEADRHQVAHELKGAEVFRRFVRVARERA